MAQFPSAVATDSNLYIAVNQKSTTITDNPLAAGATTVNVVDTSSFPSVGAITVDAEIIHYTGKTASSFTGCARGFDGTSDVSHTVNTPAYHYIIADHHNVLKEEIKAIEQNLSDRIGLGSTQLKAQDGVAATPSYSFANDLDTGMYLRSGGNGLGFASNGVLMYSVIDSVGTTFHIGTVAFIDGVVGTPATTFYNDRDTGIYRPGDNLIGFACGGTYVARFDVSGMEVQSGNIRNANGSAGAPSYAFWSDPDNGFYLGSTNAVYIATAGTFRWQFASSGDFVVNPTNAHQILASGGSAASPSYSFNVSGQTDTGIYNPSSDTIGFSTGGVLQVTINNTGISLGGASLRTSVGGSDIPRVQIEGLDFSGSSMMLTRNSANANCGALILNKSRGTVNGAVTAVNDGDLLGEVLFVGTDGTGVITGARIRAAVDGTPGTNDMPTKLDFLTSPDGSATPVINMRITPAGSTQFRDGTVSIPSMSFINDTDTGLYLGSSGGAYLGLTVGGALQFYAQNGLVMNTGVIANNAGSAGTPGYTFWTNSDTGMYLNSSDLNFSINGSTKLSVQTNYTYIYNTLMPNGAANYNQGDASNYWNEINYKTLTDRGCLPWCDDGVELQDGTVVSDTEAIKTMAKHPTKKTIHGLPMLDYKTFPKKSYKKAAVEGELLKRDINDDPIGGADGVEMTMVFGVMIGAIKELTQRIEALESK